MTIKKVEVVADKSPKTYGPFPQGVKIGEQIFTSMILPINVEGTAIIGKDAASQAKQCIKSLINILDATTAAISQVTKLNIYVTNLADIQQIDPVIIQEFLGAPPARSIICVTQLPYRVLVAIDATAQLTKAPFQGGGVI